MESHNDPTISTREKSQFWRGAWMIVAVVSLAPHPSQILLVPFFPLGLLALLPHGDEKAISGWMSVTPCLLGWIFYALLSLALFKVSKKQLFLLLYLGFCVLLALNVIDWEATVPQ